MAAADEEGVAYDRNVRSHPFPHWPSRRTMCSARMRALPSNATISIYILSAVKKLKRETTKRKGISTIS